MSQKNVLPVRSQRECKCDVQVQTQIEALAMSNVSPEELIKTFSRLSKVNN